MEEGREVIYSISFILEGGEGLKTRAFLFVVCLGLDLFFFSSKYPSKVVTVCAVLDTASFG